MVRGRSSQRFEVVLQASSADEPIIVLRSTADPNLATMAFHEELQRLTIQGAVGELHMRKHHGTRPPILRQPLDRHARTPAHNPSNGKRTEPRNTADAQGLRNLAFVPGPDTAPVSSTGSQLSTHQISAAPWQRHDRRWRRGVMLAPGLHP